MAASSDSKHADTEKSTNIETSAEADKRSSQGYYPALAPALNAANVTENRGDGVDRVYELKSHLSKCLCFYSSPSTSST